MTSSSHAHFWFRRVQKIIFKLSFLSNGLQQLGFSYALDHIAECLQNVGGFGEKAPLTGSMPPVLTSVLKQF